MAVALLLFCAVEEKLVRSFKNRKECEKKDVFQKQNLQKKKVWQKKRVEENDSVLFGQEEENYGYRSS